MGRHHPRLILADLRLRIPKPVYTVPLQVSDQSQKTSEIVIPIIFANHVIFKSENNERKIRFVYRDAKKFRVHMCHLARDVLWPLRDQIPD